jgi:tetratricopeptide (TPR) repeat protein
MNVPTRCFAVVLAALGVIAPLLAQARCQVKSVELPVRMIGSRAVATVEINGTAVPLTVDSGAFFSMLTEAAASQLQLRLNRNATIRVDGVAGAMLAHTTTVDKLVLLKGEIDRVDFVVGGNEPGAGTMGLMGRNILSAADTEYDLSNGAIRFLYPNSECKELGMAYWAGKTPVTELDLVMNYRTQVPSIRADVKLNGKEFTALFDTGATSVISARPAGEAYGVSRGTVRQWVAPFDRFEIGGEAIVNGRLRVADFDLGEADMLLGIDFFLSHRIYVSKQQSRMYLTYEGGPVFALDRVVKGGPQTAETEAVPDNAEPETADQLARRSAASAARRDYDSALADLDRACALDPTSAALYVQRAGVLIALKRPEKALEDYARALELDPKQPDARFQRAALRLRRQDREGARTDLDALDGAIAAQSPMRLGMANMYMSLEQPDRAIPQLDQWLAAHPKEINRESALNLRCWARVLLGSELDRALDDCDDAVDGNDRNAAFRDSRGWVYLRQGRYKKALADFDGSLEIQPKNATSLYGRGVAKAKLGNAADGDADREAARKLQPDIERRLARTGLVAEKSEAKP